MASSAQEKVPKSTAQAAKEPFLSNIRQMTLVGKRAGEGYFSPNGRMMIFQSEREPGNPFYQMYMMNRDTGDVNRISPWIWQDHMWLDPSLAAKGAVRLNSG